MNALVNRSDLDKQLLLQAEQELYENVLVWGTVHKEIGEILISEYGLELPLTCSVVGHPEDGVTEWNVRSGAGFKTGRPWRSGGGWHWMLCRVE